MRDQNLQAMLTKAKTAHQAGDLARAAEICDAILAILPDQLDALRRASAVATQAGRLDAAAVLCRRALVLAPASIGVILRLGLLLNHGNHVTAAAHAFERVMTIKPDHYAASHNAQIARLRASHAAAAAGDWKAAIAHATRAIRTAPARHIPWRELGLIAQQAEHLDLARRALTRAAILELSDPESLNRLGYVAFGGHNIDRAERYFRFGAIIAPSHANAHLGQAECLAWRGDVAAAVAAAERAHAMAPDSAQIESRLALFLFMAGELARGRRHYEARLRKSGNVTRHGVPARWQGEALDRHHLLICSEQGIGDEIMYAVDIPATLARVRRLTIECDPRLVPIYRRSFPRADVGPHHRRDGGEGKVGHYHWLDPADPPDLHCEVGSLDLMLGGRGGDEPRKAPYLRANPARTAAWRRQFQATAPRLTVAIAWRSRVVTQHRAAAYPPLAAWAPLWRVPGVRFVAVQYGHDWIAEAQAIERDFGADLTVLDDVDTTDDMEEVFAIAAAADLVICPSSTVGWIGGALGQDTWLLLNRPSYILRGGDDIPGFPTVKVWAKDNAAPWEPLMVEVAAALATRRDRA